MSTIDEFEIVDRYGARWRYKYSEGYFWAWDDGGTEDIIVFRYCSGKADGDEFVDSAYFPKVAMVGDCTPNTCLNFNLREVPAA